MFTEDIGILLIGMVISTLILTLSMFVGILILTCFELPGQIQIPQDKWIAENEKF